MFYDLNCGLYHLKFGLAVKLVSSRTSVRFRFGFPLCSKVSKVMVYGQSLCDFAPHNRRSSEIQGTALVKCLRAWSCMYRSMSAGVAQSRHAFVGGTVSTWAR